MFSQNVSKGERGKGKNVSGNLGILKEFSGFTWILQVPSTSQVFVTVLYLLNCKIWKGILLCNIVFNLPFFVFMSQYTLIGPAVSTLIQYSPFDKLLVSPTFCKMSAHDFPGRA